MNEEHIAVTEANKLGIPVVAVVDTNVDPELVQYPIPGNDDAIRAGQLLAERLEARGLPVTYSREPGGTDLGEQIADLDPETMTPDMMTQKRALDAMLLLQAGGPRRAASQLSRPRVSLLF